MTTVDPEKSIRFRNGFHTAAEEISEDLYISRSTSANGHWEKWSAFYKDAVLDPLLVL